MLAWLGDDRTAEGIARQVIRRYEGDHRSPRRLIKARITRIGIGEGEPDEAAQLGSAAISSGWLVPSNSWRAGELESVLSRRYPDLPEARDLDEQWRHLSAGGPRR